MTPTDRSARCFFKLTHYHRDCQLQTPACHSDNRFMPKNAERMAEGSTSQARVRDPFSPGAMVIVTLGNPRDKFWSMILALAPEGLSMSGAELASFEDLVLMVKDGESFSPAVVFFPMHRIERIELDLPDGNLPSLSQRFLAKTGIEPPALLASPASRENGTERNFNFAPRAHSAARPPEDGE